MPRLWSSLADEAVLKTLCETLPLVARVLASRVESLLERTPALEKVDVFESQTIPDLSLSDYCAHIEDKRRLSMCKLKPVKNLTINASKDILIEPEGQLPVPLSIVIPCSIRDMKNQSECNQWISKVSSQGLGVWFSGFNQVVTTERDDQQLECVLVTFGSLGQTR